ncbi:MAG: hypothetical protein WCO26_01605 [Deltaproteobacteria bacterium]
MGDDFSILPLWKKLLPAEKLGNSKESLVGQVEKEIPQRKKRKRKGQGLNSDTDQESAEGAEETSTDSEAPCGKIVDITI